MRRTMLVAYLGGSLATGVFNAFNNFTLSLWLTSFTTSYFLISLLGNSRSFEGALVSPLAGNWSDKTWLGWLGRRRPFMLVGGLIAAALLALTPAISRLPAPGFLAGLPPETSRIILPLLSIFMFTMFFNLQDDIHKALLADLTEGPERNRLSSFAVVTDMGGQVLILVLGFFLATTGVSDNMFYAAGALIALGILVAVIGVREPPPGVWVGSSDEAKEHGSFFRHILEYRSAAMFCLVVFAYWSGVNAVLPLVSIYTRDILGTNEGEAQLLPALLLLGTVLAAIPMGMLGNRFGKKKMLCVGYAVMGVAAMTGLMITTKEQGAILFLLAGIGNAAGQVLTIPFLADLVPRQHMGAATGMLAAATSLSAPLSSLVSGTMADAWGPRAIFLLMMLMVVFALLLMIGVRTPAAQPEPSPA